MIKDMTLMNLTELKYWCVENCRTWSTSGVSGYLDKAKMFHAEYKRRGGKWTLKLYVKEHSSK